MIVSSRQAEIGCAYVPPIKFNEKIDIQGYETIVKVFEEALMVKYCHEYSLKLKETKKDWMPFKWQDKLIARDRKMFNCCLTQTVTYLKSIGALLQTKPIKTIELWKKAIEMKPFYEGTCAQLKTTLTKHLCPSMFKAMEKGAVYGHKTLTDISEATLYIMEYFTKEKVLENVDKVIKNEKFKETLEVVKNV